MTKKVVVNSIDAPRARKVVKVVTNEEAPAAGRTDVLRQRVASLLEVPAVRDIAWEKLQAQVRARVTFVDAVLLLVLLVLLGDFLRFYYTPYWLLVPLGVVFTVFLLVWVGRRVGTRMLLGFLVALFLFVVLGYVVVYHVLPQGLQKCPGVDSAAIPESEIMERYSVTRTIQGVDSASGNAIMLAKERGTGRPVVIKYYADPNATESIEFACSLEGDVARRFPKTLKAGNVTTTRGQALYTVQTLASGQPIDSWMQGQPSSSARRTCARNLIKRVRAFTAANFCHRDLHPGNVFVTDAGAVSFIDVDLGFTDRYESSFVDRCQRFFFEMPLKLVAFARENLNDVQQTALTGWWVYMNADRYGQFTVDQLYMVALAFITKRNYGVLAAVAKGANDEATWAKVESKAGASLDATLPTSVVPTDSATGAKMLRFMMSGFGKEAVLPGLELGDGVAARLDEIKGEFDQTGLPPRLDITSVALNTFEVNVQVNNRLTVTAALDASTSVSLRTSPGPVYEADFSEPLRISSTGLQLFITYIKADKSSQIDTRYNVQGRGVVAGLADFSIADVLGEVVSPDSPLPTGNEVMALIGYLSISDEEIQRLLRSLGSAKLSVSRLGDTPDDKFGLAFAEGGNVTVSVDQ